MADVENEFPLGYVDKRRNPKGQDLGGNNAVVAAASLNSPRATSVAALKAQLNAINATYYTPTRLNAMTKNDLVYAVRLSDDAAGIN